MLAVFYKVLVCTGFGRNCEMVMFEFDAQIYCLSAFGHVLSLQLHWQSGGIAVTLPDHGKSLLIGR